MREESIWYISTRWTVLLISTRTFPWERYFPFIDVSAKSSIRWVNVISSKQDDSRLRQAMLFTAHQPCWFIQQVRELTGLRWTPPSASSVYRIPVYRFRYGV